MHATENCKANPGGAVSAWLGWFGIVGYTVFIFGIVADGFGANEFGLLLVIPGALLEVTFAVWLTD